MCLSSGGTGIGGSSFSAKLGLCMMGMVIGNFISESRGQPVEKISRSFFRWYNDGSYNLMNSLVCSLNVPVMALDVVKFLSGPHSSRHEGCLHIICCSDFSDVYIKSPSFSL